MPPLSLRIAGTLVETLGLLVERWSGDLTTPVGRPPSAAVPRRLGEVPTGAGAAVPPRTFTITGTLVAATPEALTTAWRALLTLCAGASTRATRDGTSAGVTLALPTSPDRVWTVYLDAAQGDRLGAPLARRAQLKRDVVLGGPGVAAGRLHAGTSVSAASVTLPLVALDPIATDAVALTPALGVAIARLAVGDVASPLVVTLSGPLAAGASRTVTLVDGADQAAAALTVTVPAGQALAAGESLEIDSAAETITQVAVGGARTPRAAWLAAGDFFDLDPALSVAGVTPGLVLSAGVGAASYRRTWRA